MIVLSLIELTPTITRHTGRADASTRATHRRVVRVPPEGTPERRPTSSTYCLLTMMPAKLITREAFEDNKIVKRLHVARDGAEDLGFVYRRGEHHNAPRPDLISCALDLPEYDGRQILEIPKSDPGLHHIPVG
jgi:hypothetical protein